MWLVLGIVALVIGILCIYQGSNASNGLFLAIGVLLVILGILLIIGSGTGTIGGDTWLPHPQQLTLLY